MAPIGRRVFLSISFEISFFRQPSMATGAKQALVAIRSMKRLLQQKLTFPSAHREVRTDRRFCSHRKSSGVDAQQPVCLCILFHCFHVATPRSVPEGDHHQHHCHQHQFEQPFAVSTSFALGQSSIRPSPGHRPQPTTAVLGGIPSLFTGQVHCAYASTATFFFMTACAALAGCQLPRTVIISHRARWGTCLLGLHTRRQLITRLAAYPGTVPDTKR